MSCGYCARDAIYRCSVCGDSLCPEHTRLRTVCHSCIGKTPVEYTIDRVTSTKERKEIREFIRRFWGEQEQLTFDRKIRVTDLPAYVAKSENKVVGFISFVKVKNGILIVALGVFPSYQGSGVGRSLVKKVEDEAKNMAKKKLLVSTSNDDLPALAFYQSLGFQIYDVKPDVIAEKHSRVLEGISGLPVRDELRLLKTLR